MDKLRELILFEQYRNTLPEIVATYVAECQVKTASEAALLVDDWELIHKPYVERFSERQVHTWVNSSVVPVGPWGLVFLFIYFLIYVGEGFCLLCVCV